MDEMTQAVAEERVATGVKFLNKNLRGWKTKIVASKLDIGDFACCIDGQLRRADEEATSLFEALDCDAQAVVEHGFDLAFEEKSDDAYKLLTKAWKAELR